MSDTAGVAVDLGRYAGKIGQQRDAAMDEVAKLGAAVDQLVEENAALKEENAILKKERGDISEGSPTPPPPPGMRGSLDDPKT